MGAVGGSTTSMVITGSVLPSVAEIVFRHQQAQAQQAQKQIGDSEIHCPIDGIILAIMTVPFIATVSREVVESAVCV